MKKLLAFLSLLFLPGLIIVFSIAHAQENDKQEVLSINLHYKDKQVSLKSIEKILGYVPDYLNQPEIGYGLVIYGEDSEELFNIKFDFPLQIFKDDFSDPQNPKGSSELLTEADKSLIVPVLGNARQLKVLDLDGKLVFEQDISPILKTDFSEAGREQVAKIPDFLLWAGGVGLLIIAGVIIFLLRKKMVLGSLVYPVLIISFIVIVLGAVWLLLNRGKLQQRPAAFPTPTPVTRIEPKTLRKEAYAILQALTKTNQKVGDLVLADNLDFQIIYLISNDQFMVFVKKPPYNSTKEKAEKWFLDKGFLPNELCLLRINFYPGSKEVEPDFSFKNSFSGGCPVPTLKPSAT